MNGGRCKYRRWMGLLCLRRLSQSDDEEEEEEEVIPPSPLLLLSIAIVECVENGQIIMGNN